MKIAVINPGMHPILYDFCKSLVKIGYEVTLIVPKLKHEKIVRGGGFKIIYLPPTFIFADLPFSLKLYDILANHDFDLIQANEDFQPFTLIAALYSKNKGKPFFLISEKYFPSRFRLFSIMYALNRYLIAPFIWATAKKIICHSKENERYMRQLVPFKEKLIQLPIGVDTGLFHKPRGFHKKQQDPAALNVLSVGRLIMHKDFKTLIRAVGILCKHGVNIKLTIVGDGPLYPGLSKLIDELQLKDRVVFKAPVSRSKLSHVYSETDIFVLPSIIEMMGSVVLEAMACGLPVIVSDAGGPKDFVMAGQSGFIFKAGNPQDLANKIQKLTDPSMRIKFGVNGHNLVKTKFDWTSLIQKYDSAFKG